MRFIVITIVLCSLCGCGEQAPDEVVLTGRAILHADTFASGPEVGTALPPEINGRRLPFDNPPVQGFSSLILDGPGAALVLQDNGFGTRANSPDYPLRWYHVQLIQDDPTIPDGLVGVVAVTTLTDPRGRIPFPIRYAEEGRVLAGSDFDPESFCRLPDGTFWIGEEFGPFLLHTDNEGRLLLPPVPVPVPDALLDHARGLTDLRSPDHPDLRSLTEELAMQAANLPRSGGLEGMAMLPDGSLLYLAVEKALLDDPDRTRRLILEFEPRTARFTGRHWIYRVEAENVSIASMEAFDTNTLLVTERDEAEGTEARIKKIFRAELQEPGSELAKSLLVDLLDIADPGGLTTAESGAVGLGPSYAFPYVTPECLAILNGTTLVVANDNNYPMSTGRRGNAPDDNEFIRLQLPRPLDEER